MLDLQLVVVDHRQVGPGGGDAIEQRRAERVVAARVVAPAEDDEPHQSPLRPRLDQRAVGVENVDFERHLAERMGRAGQARIVGADRHLDVVEQPLGDLAAGEEARRDGADRLVHRLVVVGRRDDEVAIGDEVVVADPVVMEQRAARRLDHADAFAAPRPLVGHQIRADDVGIVEQVARHFGGVAASRSCAPSGTSARRAAACRCPSATNLRRSVFGERRRQAVGDLDARQRADAIPAVFRARAP